MGMEGLLENNTVVIYGEIIETCRFSHEVYGEKFYIFKIRSQRLSNQVDILPITISERLCDKEELKLNIKVHVFGQLRSYNNYDGRKNKLVLTIFAREISINEERLQGTNNEICLDGYICKAPIYRKTPFGREITDVLIAVNRAYNKSDYIPCIAWGRNARYIGRLEVGAHIKVYGRAQSRSYNKKIGDEIEQKIAYEVSIGKIEISLSQERSLDKTLVERQ